VFRACKEWKKKREKDRKRIRKRTGERTGNKRKRTGKITGKEQGKQGKKMFVDSAYWHNSRIDFKDRKHPLFVGSCGTYRLMTTTKLPTHRPRGRVDFQLLYVAAGKGHFYFNGKEHIVPAGNMVLYRPREEQRYYYYGADHTEVYWVHFTGSNVTNILRRYGFRDGEHVIHTGTSLEYSHIFRQIIEELRACRPHYEESCIYRLHLLFILLSRLDEKKTRRRSPHMAGQMNTAVNYFHEHYSEPISIGDYAQSLGLSVSWFTRSFREYTGSSPAQYLISLRISAAQSLLETSDHNVSEISELVGYDNPLYFSRLFHKQTGMSPSDFRRQLQAWNEENP
jgi:AraC-like DNA-binding protein